MDPMTLAAAAVTALRPFLGTFTDGALGRAGEAAADTAGSRVRELYLAVRRRMTGDAYHQAILQGAEDRPDSEGRLGTLTEAIGEIVAEDPEFATALAALLDGMRIQAADSGAVAGRDIHQTGTYVAGRDLIMGRPDLDTT